MNRRIGIVPTTSTRMNSVLLMHMNSHVPLSNIIVSNRDLMSASPMANRPIPMGHGCNSRIISNYMGASNVLGVHIRGILRRSVIAHVLSDMRGTTTDGPAVSHFVAHFTHVCAPFIITTTMLATIVPSLVANS